MEKIKTRKRKKIDRRIRYIVGVLFLVILGLRVTMVEAGSNDSIIERNRINDIYAITNIGGVDRIFYLNMYKINGKISYCIELGVDITNDIYNSTDDFYFSNLNEEQIEYIKNVSYFGYGYSNHESIEYYMATQEIIWEYLSNVSVEWTNVMNVNGEKFNIDNYKNEIISLVNDYYKGINLNGYSDNMDVVIDEEFIFDDININLKYYDAVDGKSSYARIDDNKLYVKFDTNYVGKDVIRLKRKDIYEYDSMLYYRDNSQKLISNGNISDEIELVFNIRGKRINFQVKDSVEIKHNNQFNYFGIDYELFNSDNKYFGRLGCDALGKFNIDNMPYGKYKIRGIGVNRAYYFDKIEYDFYFSGEEIIYLDVHPVINSFKFLKLYGDEEQLEKESGIEFEIYNNDGSVYSEFVTDANGESLVSLPYGKYVIKQKNSSYGYAMVDDILINVVRKKSDVINYTLVDNAIKSNLIINAKDSEGNIIIEDGISYKIKKDDKYLEFGGGSEFVSIDGQMILPSKISYGNYIVEIVNNSKNYKNIFDDIELTIDDNSDFIFRDNELLVELDIIYDVKKGGVIIDTYKEKIDYYDNNYEYSYVKKENVELEMIADSDIVINNTVIYKSGDTVFDVITDKDGKYVLSDVYLGNYCLVDKSMKKVCFEVVSDINTEVKINENLQKSSVVIENISSDMEKIMGTVIEVFNKDGQVVYVGSTNEEGVIKINDLIYGDYCIKERSVDDIYLLNEEEICFSINSDKVVELEIVNKKRGREIVFIPNTFSDKKSVRKLGVLIILFIGGIFYKIKIYNKRN